MTPPRLYLVTPAVIPPGFATTLATLLDGFDIACLRVSLATGDADAIRRQVEPLRALARARSVDVVLSDHFRLAAELGLDGVHLSDGARHVRDARRTLGRDAIVGAHARASRHEGMIAADLGADYISLGPVADSPLGDGRLADVELFAWWAEMIETPVVAEGGVSPDLAGTLADAADFLALGDELWDHPAGPEAALAAIAGAIRAGRPVETAGVAAL